MENITLFCEVYCKFLSKITDEMFITLTYQDTLKLLRNMLTSAIVNFKFPKKNIRQFYLISSTILNCDNKTIETIENKINEDTFTDYCDYSEEIFMVSNDLENLDHWAIKLDLDEIEILALLMKKEWLSQQMNTVNLLQMRPSSSDFEMPSQANHIAKLTEWIKQTSNEIDYLQNLYNRRIIDEEGMISPNYKSLGGKKRVRKKQIRL